ncbi:hypothetical protein CJ010_22875 [Azoarcus sp. DD4]|nr:hypothetical protein CJ010_22875 [Azoarcus sp. DD4]
MIDAATRIRHTRVSSNMAPGALTRRNTPRMNTPVRIAVVAATVALAYPASAWYLGQRVETALNEQYAQLADLPYLRVVERNYDRGVFGATETVTVEFADPRPATAEGEQGAAAQPLRLTVLTRIKHGPLPGFSTLAAAVADSELVLDEAARKEIATVLGDRKPVELHTVYRFDGGGTGTLTSPAFATTLPANGDGSASRVSWDGVKLDLDFSAGLKQYSLQGNAPKLEIEDDSMRLVLAGLALEGKQQRVFDDDALLYAGTQKLSAAELSFQPKAGADEASMPVLLQQLAYDIEAPVNGEFLDIVARIGAAVVKVGDQDYGPAHYDLSLKHLHARTTAKLYRELMKVSGDPTLASTGDAAGAALSALSGPAMELLSHSPEISLDRISFNSPHGEARVAARIKLADIKPEDYSNAFALIGKVDASGEAALPLGLLTAWQGDGEVGARKAARFNQQLAGLTAQGYVTQEAGLVKSALVFRQGQLTINGKPFNPLALGELAGGGEHEHDHDMTEEDVEMLDEMEAE